MLLSRVLILSHCFRRLGSGFDAFPQGRSFEIVPRKEKPGVGTLAIANGFDDMTVAEIVLWQRLRVTPDGARDGRSGNLKHAGVFSLDDRGDFCFGLFDKLRRCCTAHKAGHRGYSFWGTTGEEGGVPDGPEGLEFLFARNEKAKTFGWAPDLPVVIGGGNNGHRRISNSGKSVRERR